MTVMNFFTGCDGLVLWNWSGTGSHQVPPPLKPEADVMVGRRFEVKAEGAAEGAALVAFERYDVLHIKGVGEDGAVRFQRIEKEDPGGKYGITEDKPVYAMPAADLTAHLRAQAEPVSALIEGLALVKPLEKLLHEGEVKVDVPASEQFSGSLPIVRRVRSGRYHVLVTYDPTWATAKEPREIVLNHFDGHAGLKVTLPADAETRVFLLRE